MHFSQWLHQHYDEKGPMAWLAFLLETLAGATRITSYNVCYTKLLRARQYLFDQYHYHLLGALSSSTDAQVAAIAAKGLKEVTYHLRRSSAWIKRLV